MDNKPRCRIGTVKRTLDIEHSRIGYIIRPIDLGADKDII